DRFMFSSLRDSNSTTAGVQVSFDPAALLKGTAHIGYRHFEPAAAGVAPFKGTTAAVNLAYALLEATKLNLSVTRDVQYSYDVNEPYYLQTGYTGSVAQQIFGPVDVVAGLGAYTLAYRNRADVLAPLSDRTDRVHLYHGGVGYHLGPELRIGVKVEKQWRDSVVPQRT